MLFDSQLLSRSLSLSHTDYSLSLSHAHICARCLTQMLCFATMPALRLLCASLILTWATLSSCADEEVEFGYGDGPTGPENWGNLLPEWKLCSSGRSQSPIDVRKKDLQRDRIPHTLKFSNTSGSAQLELTENALELSWMENGGSIYWDEEEYKLLNLHWHTPSEHSINGVRFPLEAHMVHEDHDGKKLVVALQYKYGEEDDFLAKVMQDFTSTLHSEIQDHLVGNVSLSSMNYGEKYYHYMGSLTTPPCTEGVTWIIMRKKRNVSEEQVNAIIKALSGENARPKQHLNGRNIYKY